MNISRSEEGWEEGGGSGGVKLSEQGRPIKIFHLTKALLDCHTAGWEVRQVDLEIFH